MAETTIDLVQQAQSADLPGSGGGDASERFGNLLGTLMSGIMMIAAILVFLYLIWGAIEWITSGGEKGKLEEARNKITNAILGIIVLAASTAIFVLVQNFLGICVLDFGGSC